MKNRYLIVLTVVLRLSLSPSESGAQNNNENEEAIAGEVIMASPDKVHISTVFQRFNDRNEPIATYSVALPGYSG